jgi:hypothetical protein
MLAIAILINSAGLLLPDFLGMRFSPFETVILVIQDFPVLPFFR